MHRRLKQEEIPERIGSHYRVLAELGEGGMGSVFLAEDERIAGSRIALKLVAQTGRLYDQSRRRFERETQLMNELGQDLDAAVRGGGFLQVKEWGRDGPYLYLAMSLVPNARPLDLAGGSSRVRLLRLVTACRLVMRAHERGIIHRDLKPGNFLQSERGRIYLSDFGLAKVLAKRRRRTRTPELTTEPGVAIGTPAFMPPEQFEDVRSVDERADVFALGVMLFLALSGRYPYGSRGKTEVEAHQRRVLEGHASVPRPGEHAEAEVPPELDELCVRALEPDRDERLGSVRELLHGIEAFLRKDKASRPSPLPRTEEPPALPPERSALPRLLLAGGVLTVAAAAVYWLPLVRLGVSADPPHPRFSFSPIPCAEEPDGSGPEIAGRPVNLEDYGWFEEHGGEHATPKCPVIHGLGRPAGGGTLQSDPPGRIEGTKWRDAECFAHCLDAVYRDAEARYRIRLPSPDEWLLSQDSPWSLAQLLDRPNGVRTELTGGPDRTGVVEWVQPVAAGEPAGPRGGPRPRVRVLGCGWERAAGDPDGPRTYFLYAPADRPGDPPEGRSHSGVGFRLVREPR